MRGFRFNYLFLLIFIPTLGWASPELEVFQQKIRAAGDDMLENLEVSYVYGGSQVGDATACDACNRCLEEKSPAPKLRFKECPTCHHCSLDCSHFVQLVFAKAGLGFPYITSTQMLDLGAGALEKKYNLRPVADRLDTIIAGDMLVYRGHVVIVERVHDPGVADIIHATGGKDIRLPGQGIQRERFVRVSHFRGPLLRVVRHATLDQMQAGDRSNAVAPAPRTTATRHFKLRPVEKRIRD